MLFTLNLLLLDPGYIRFGNDVPRSHVLLQALVDASTLLGRDLVLGLENALVETVLGDFVHQFRGISHGQLLFDLVLELRLDILGQQRCWVRAEKCHFRGKRKTPVSGICLGLHTTTY